MTCLLHFLSNQDWMVRKAASEEDDDDDDDDEDEDDNEIRI